MFYPVPEVVNIQSFRILSNTSASVSWSELPPIDHNGILSAYIVRVTNMNTSSAINETVPANETSFMLMLDGEYYVSVYRIKYVCMYRQRFPESPILKMECRMNVVFVLE